MKHTTEIGAPVMKRGFGVKAAISEMKLARFRVRSLYLTLHTSTYGRRSGPLTG
jgi:hypothetical protein